MSPKKKENVITDVIGSSAVILNQHGEQERIAVPADFQAIRNLLGADERDIVQFVDVAPNVYVWHNLSSADEPNRFAYDRLFTTVQSFGGFRSVYHVGYLGSVIITGGKYVSFKDEAGNVTHEFQFDGVDLTKLNELLA